MSDLIAHSRETLVATLAVAVSVAAIFLSWRHRVRSELAGRVALRNVMFFGWRMADWTLRERLKRRSTRRDDSEVKIVRAALHEMPLASITRPSWLQPVVELRFQFEVASELNQGGRVKRDEAESLIRRGEAALRSLDDDLARDGISFRHPGEPHKKMACPPDALRLLRALCTRLSGWRRRNPSHMD